MAEALLAFRDSSPADTEEGGPGYIGAMLVARAIDNLETCAQFARAYAKWMENQR